MSSNLTIKNSASPVESTKFLFELLINLPKLLLFSFDPFFGIIFFDDDMVACVYDILLWWVDHRSSPTEIQNNITNRILFLTSADSPSYVVLIPLYVFFGEKYLFQMAVKLRLNFRSFYGFNTNSLVLEISVQVQRIKQTTNVRTTVDENNHHQQHCKHYSNTITDKLANEDTENEKSKTH